MRLELAFRGELKKFMEMEERAAARAVTTSMRRASTGLKNEMRRQTIRAGLGERLARTWRSNVYPRSGISLGAASEVRSVAATKKYGPYGFVFEEGATIQAKNGKWLAFDATGGRIGGRKIKISDAKNMKLQFIPSKNPNFARLIQRVNGQEKTIFFLVKQVRIKKRWDFAGASNKWGDKIPGYILSEWSRASSRIS